MLACSITESTYGRAKIFEKCSQDAARFYEINPLFRLGETMSLSFLESARYALAGHVHPFLRAQWEKQKQNPSGSLGAAIMLVDSVAKITSKVGIPKPPTTLEILDGSFFKPQKVYEIAETSLVGTSGVGAVTTTILLITGLHSISAVTGLLSVGTLAGAYMAHQAATQRSLADSIEDARRQAQAFEKNNQELTQQNALFSIQNAAFSANITYLEGQNTALRNNIESLRAQVSQFALQNQHYRTIANDFRGYIKQFRTDAADDREQFTKRLDDFTQQISALQELWRSFSNETTIFRENYATQLNQLRDLIDQITDPRGTLIRLQEHRAINEQIQVAVTRLEQLQRELSNLDAQIALRDGQLRARDELLDQLRSAHQQILSSYQHQTTTLGAGNVALTREIDRITSLIDRHFDTSIEVIINIPVPLNHVFGMRKGPDWRENVSFNPSHAGWTGRVPIGKEFKFVLIPTHGNLRWEGGANRMLLTPAQGQHEINLRQPVF